MKFGYSYSALSISQRLVKLWASCAKLSKAERNSFNVPAANCRFMYWRMTGSVIPAIPCPGTLQERVQSLRV